MSPTISTASSPTPIGLTVSAQRNRFRSFIFRWWRTHQRQLPWRTTSDPYRILVSEVMLQQTQVPRVLPAYHSFLMTFPTVAVLASADAATVIRMWRGLGYNRRAVYLRDAARQIVREFDGVVPDDEAALRTLPGVGEYTARAVLVYAYRRNVALVDTNVRQILVYHFFGGQQVPNRQIQSLATELVPPGRSWEWHQALMDYGAMGLPKSRTVRRRPGSASSFRGSDRFLRGRIIDRLRECPTQSAGELYRYLGGETVCTQVRFDRILADLHRDRLVSERDGSLELPV